MTKKNTPAFITGDAARWLEIMDRLIQASSAHETVDALAQEFCVISAEVFGGMAALQLLNRQNELMHVAGLHDIDPHAEELFRAAVDAMSDQPRDQGAAGRIILTGEPLLIPALPEEALRQFNVPEFLRYVDEIGMSTSMGIPLKGRAGTLGVLTLSRHRGGAPYNEDDLALLTRMGSRMSIGLENLMLVESLRAQVSMVEAAAIRERHVQAAEPQPIAPHREAEMYRRLTRALTDHGDDLHRLSQDFCEIVGDSIGDLAALVIRGDTFRVTGIYDTDPDARLLLTDLAAAMEIGLREGSIAKRVLETGAPVFQSPIAEGQVRAFAVPQFQRYLDRVGVSSLLAVPLRAGAATFGVLNLYRHRDSQPYTEDDLGLAQRLAAWMRLALQKLLPGTPVAAAQSAQARALFDRLIEAVEQHGDDVDNLAQEFAVLLAESLGDMAAISLLNPHNDMLRVAGLYDVDAEARAMLGGSTESRNVMPRNNSAAKSVLESGQAVLRSALTADELRNYATPWFQPFLERFGASSLMAVPLKGRSGSIGVANVLRHGGRTPYTEDDLRMLTDLATRMQLALENVLLRDALRDGGGPASLLAGGPRGHPYLDTNETDRLYILHRLTHIIAENRERPGRMTELVAVLACEALGGACSITLLNRHDEVVHIAAYYDADPRAHFLLGELVRATQDMPRDAGIAGQVIRTGEPVIVPGVDEEQVRQVNLPAVTQFIEEIGVSSTLAVPLKGASSIVGALSLSRHRGEPPFTNDDRAFAVEIAYRLAVGVENQQLIESLRREALNASSAELALNASEERFRSVFDSPALGIEIMDAAGVVIDVNRAFERLSGYTRAEMFGRRYGSLQHPDDVDELLQRLTQVKMNRQSDEPLENRIVRLDGSTLWVRTHLAPVRKADDGAVSFIVALHENITGRKQAEQYFEAVLESTPDALIMVDGNGVVRMVNRQAETLFGYGRSELLGMAVESLLPERFREIHPLHRADDVESPALNQVGIGRELHAVTKEGAEVPVEASLSHLNTDDGPVVVAAIRDITERKRRDAALIRSERSLAEAQRVARLGSLEYDLVSGAVEASDEALRILDMHREEVSGSGSILEHMHPEDRDRVTDLTRNVLVTRVPAEFEFRVPLPDGSERIVHDRVVPYFAPDGKPTRILGTVQDVTEQRLAEREMNELKNHLQSSVELERLRLAQELHDGPMQELYGASYRLDELKADAPNVLQGSLEDVNAQIQSTVNDLRAIAKELRPPAISNFGLEKAIRSYMEDFQAKHPGISLKMSLAHDHQMLPENVRMTLFRVLQQAMGNVLRHSQATEVAVQFSLDAEEARLAISDNGRGFTVPSNWMSFVRQGHYGLAGAAERVNALGGILLVDSDPARSTTITAVIPWTPAG
ncbi:MAG: PAS domain S-box protein [Anaerolineae bacterium]